jgi:hypothetical protein
LDPAIVRLFLKHITELCPLNEFLVTLVKDYTITALSRNPYYKKSYCNEGDELGLTFYWSIINSESHNYQLKLKVVEAFAAVIGDLYYSK